MAEGVDDDAQATARLFARVFAGGDGEAVLDWMRRVTIERELAPDAPGDELRDLEGQRRPVRWGCNMVKRGTHG